MMGLTSPHTNKLTPNTILQGHLDLALPETIIIGLKKYKQARAFFPLNQNESWYSQH